MAMSSCKRLGKYGRLLPWLSSPNYDPPFGAGHTAYPINLAKKERECLGHQTLEFSGKATLNIS